MNASKINKVIRRCEIIESLSELETTTDRRIMAGVAVADIMTMLPQLETIYIDGGSDYAVNVAKAARELVAA